MDIIDVFFCVFLDNSTAIDVDADSCFDNSGFDTSIWYLFSTTNNGTDQGYMDSDDIILDNDNNLHEQFSFIIPKIESGSTYYSLIFGVQITVELTISNNGRRRNIRLLLDGTVGNEISQTFKSSRMTIINEESVTDDDADDNDDSSEKGGSTSIGNIFGENSVLYWIIIGIGFLLILAVLIIVGLLYKSKKREATKIQRQTSIEMQQHEQGNDENINRDIIVDDVNVKSYKKANLSRQSTPVLLNDVSEKPTPAETTPQPPTTLEEIAANVAMPTTTDGAMETNYGDLVIEDQIDDDEMGDNGMIITQQQSFAF